LKNILITSAGRRVSLVRAFQKELKDFFSEALVFTSDANPLYSAACHIADKAFVVPSISDSSYIPILLQICVDNNIGLVVPTIDTELQLLAENTEKFENKGVKIIVSSSDFIIKCRDKRLTNLLFESINIPIPARIDPQNPVFPIFVKPYNGSLSKGILLIDSPEKLRKELRMNDELMFMEYLNPIEYEEYTVDMYFGKDNKLKCLVPRRRIEIRGGEISKGITQKNEVYDFLKEAMSYIKGAIGCLTVQVFLHKVNKKVIGIEINPRFGGGFPLSYLAGANYPKYLIEEYILDKGINYTEDWETNLMMLRYDAEILVHE
jgi:carbamoyl-phosphate synthase large subunit